MENLKKLSLPLEEIFIERKWGAGLCAFVVYSVLFFLFNIVLMLIVLVPKLHLVLTDQLSLTLFIFICISTFFFFGGALFSGWSIYWFFKRKYAYFQPFCKLWIFMQLFYFRAGDLPVVAWLLLAASIIASVCVLSRYVDKSKALKRYFGEE